LSAKTWETSVIGISLSAGSPVNFPIFISVLGSTPIARATAWPFGNRIRQPRIRFREASEASGFPPSESGGSNGGFGSDPSGSTSEVSIL
jgi:hypothetical protein